MWNSIFAVTFIANALFVVIIAATGFFLVRSFKDGYWGEHGEDIKYRVFDEDEEGKRP